jgi:hypothetical protein
LLQALAAVLNVDYVVWGELTEQNGVVQVQSAIYDRVSGKRLAADFVRAATNDAGMGGKLADRLIQTAASSGADVRLAASFTSFQGDAAARNAMLTPVADTPAQRDQLLTGMEALEQALAYELGSTKSALLLDKSEKALKASLENDLRNPLAYLFLANCQFNQAHRLVKEGQQDAAKAQIQDMKRSLNKAYSLINNSPYDYVKKEIQADYDLLFKKDYASAIAAYSDLADMSKEMPLNASLRGSWMLAGIYSGDWLVPAENVNAEMARKNLVRILAHFPDSAEAEFIRRNLRWDEQQGTNRFEYMPRVNDTILIDE